MAVTQSHIHQHSFKMMEEGLERPQSALLRGVQITEFKDSRVNPQPIVLEESDVLMEGYLSPTKLRLLAGVDNLESVHSLEMTVNTCDTSLGNFGTMLPNLTQLRLSNSMIRCVRDVGSSLRNLKVLWMSRCGLQELDGLSAISQLTELYLSYNEISDLSPVSMLEKLQILDLEGNNIEDISQIQYLELCSQLQILTLEANPVCVMPTPDSQEKDYDYRATIKSMLPQLKSLDDEPIVNVESSKKANVFDEDWAFLDNLQKDLSLQNLNSLDSTDDDSAGISVGTVPALTNFRPGSALRPSSGMRPLTAVPQTSPSIVRPKTRGSQSPGSSAGRPGTAARPLSSEENEVSEASSALTTGSVICGNPCRALRSRRGDSFTPPAKETTPKLFVQYRHKAEHTYDPAPLEGQNSEELLEDLKAWREHHDEVIKKIQKEKAPQVLRIVPNETADWSDSEDLTDSDEDVESEEESGIQVLSSIIDTTQQPVATGHVKPPTQPTTDSGRPRTPEFRSRRYHTPTHQTDTHQPTASAAPCPQGRQGPSFEDGDGVSADLRTLRQPSPCSVRSVGVNHQSPIPSVIPTKPPVPSIPKNSTRERPSVHEPLRPASGVSGVTSRVPTSRAALALPSQLRVKRQLPNVPVPSQKSWPGEGL